MCVRYFELNFLRLMGYGVGFWGCGKCRKTTADAKNDFFLNSGSDGFTCSECGGSGLRFSSSALESASKLLEGRFHNVNPCCPKRARKN
ncbi:MAG: hypothetical protein KatS3mg101_0364 [Patescibacteria group bacterium]|nr:MAG: hypothetical protein KatS3mg101_0364 [Patescibacteria group bacterium]